MFRVDAGIARRVVSWSVVIVPLVGASRPETLAAQAMSIEQFRRAAEVDALRAMLDPTTNARVQDIWWRLVRSTGRMFPVLPAQNFNIGQALPNGIVLLDLSTAGNENVEVTAFFLAHEWGHQVLGHTRMTLGQQGMVQMAFGPTASEDAADRWAARFVKAQRYDTSPIYAYLCSLPGGGPGDSHSSGPERAHTAQRVLNDTEGDVCADTPDPDDRREPETVDVRFSMWSRSEGNLTSLDMAIDDGEQSGSMTNLGSTDDRRWEASGLAIGVHRFTLSEIVVFNPLGVAVAGPFSCSGSFRVTRSSTRMSIAARVDAYGRVICAITGGP